MEGFVGRRPSRMFLLHFFSKRSLGFSLNGANRCLNTDEFRQERDFPERTSWLARRPLWEGQERRKRLKLSFMMRDLDPRFSCVGPPGGSSPAKFSCWAIYVQLHLVHFAFPSILNNHRFLEFPLSIG